MQRHRALATFLCCLSFVPILACGRPPNGSSNTEAVSRKLLAMEELTKIDLFHRPRWPEPLQNSPEYAQVVEGALAPEREFERELERWLVQRKR